MVTTLTGIRAGIFSREKVAGSNTALMRLIRVFIVARFSYITANLLPKAKHLISKRLGGAWSKCIPIMGKLRVFWEIMRGTTRKCCENTQRGCRPGVEAGFGGAEPGDQKRPTSLRLISRGVRR